MLLKRFFTVLQFLLFLGLGLFLVWWMARGITDDGWKQISNSLEHARYFLMIPVFILLLLSHYLRALRWKILMEPLGYSPSTFNVFNAVMIGYMANLAFPRLGEVLKCTVLARYEKAAPDKLIGTIVAERAVDVVCLLLVFFITIIVQIDKVGSFALGLLQQILRGADQQFSWLRLIIFVAAVLFFAALIKWLFQRFGDNTIIKKIKNIFKGVWSGLMTIRYIKQKTNFILYSIFIWVLYLTSTRIGFYALQEVSHLGIKEALSVLSFGSVGMIVTQGGIGAYQYAVQETLLLYDITPIMGFIFGWIIWIAQTVVLLAGGLFSMIVLSVYNRKKAAT
ncbi:MAG: flippase-like domain-containing protein [Chitinophagaceae bacterium]|nr:flippase-like domain-containing protein [Chitinophagaceae bacterium]